MSDNLSELLAAYEAVCRTRHMKPDIMDAFQFSKEAEIGWPRTLRALRWMLEEGCYCDTGECGGTREHVRRILAGEESNVGSP